MWFANFKKHLTQQAKAFMLAKSEAKEKRPNGFAGAKLIRKAEDKMLTRNSKVGLSPGTGPFPQPYIIRPLTIKDFPRSQQWWRSKRWSAENGQRERARRLAQMT